MDSTGNYKASRPKKEEKQKRLHILISPGTEKGGSDWFGFDAHQAKLFFELILPSIKIEVSSIKDYYIPSFPYDPAGSDDDFSKYDTIEVTCSCDYHVEWRQVGIPLRVHLVGLCFCKSYCELWAVEKQLLKK